jgi:uncharacterized protein (TIGR03435 family)
MSVESVIGASASFVLAWPFRTMTNCIVLALLAVLSASADQSRPAFEVASVKPAAPTAPELPEMAAVGMPGFRSRLQDLLQSAHPAGWLPTTKTRLTLRNRSLVDLIATAYRVRTDQVSGPSWMSQLKFDIDAKIPEDAPPNTANEMLQSLLEDRFKLRLHRESKDLSGYALVVGKGGPKLARAAPSDTGGPPTLEDLKNNAAKAASSGAEGSSTRWSRKNATTADLAEHLSQITHKPVLDMTAIEGAYDLDLETTSESDAAQAIAKLGLKLEPRKLPTTILVVDNLAETPTPN